MLTKQVASITFGQGLNTKADPYQVPVGQFLALNNMVFDKLGRLTKRVGFDNITSLPNANQTTLTTLNDNLIATGSNLYAYNEDNNQWLNQGIVQPVELSTLPMVRTNTNQSDQDMALAPSGLACLVYMDASAGPCYQISDSRTSQQIVPRTIISYVSAYNPRVFLLGNYFIITYTTNISPYQLIYMAIPINHPAQVGIPVVVSSTVDNPSTTAGAYDGYVVAANDTLYLSWSGGGAVRTIGLTSGLVLSAISTITAASQTLITVTADSSSNLLWVVYESNSTNNAHAAGYSYSLVPLVAPTLIGTVTAADMTAVAVNGVLTVFFQEINDYGYDTSIRTDYIESATVTPPTTGTGVGTVTALTVILRSVGLASKAFTQYTYTLKSNPLESVISLYLPMAGSYNLIDATTYMLVAYGDIHQTNPSTDSNQPSYFLIDSTGNIYMRLAYSNGGGYARSQVLPTVSLLNNHYYCPYLITDFITTVNKGTNLPSGTPTNPIFTQTGISLATFGLNISNQYSSQIASALHLTGGMLWEYDGVKPVEHGFHVWPENIEGSTIGGAGGSVGVGTYYYQFTYEWTDAAGNIHRSAPSIPVEVSVATANSTNTLNVPTLRLTYKQPFLPGNQAVNPVRIVGYRWSAAQQVYYQFTPIGSQINDPTIDYVSIVDGSSDAQILGNATLYTTGGVVEDIAAPASIASALFNNRLFLIDAEDRNLLWFSKQVIENVPVEMSDLLTLYIAPTTGAQGSTGPMTALSAMDDKLIIFKTDAIYYINGTGPDNTGSNSSFSDPVFITSTVGCANPASIVLMPMGLMFQSDKGIWLLGRDLSTTYIGAPVEQYNSQIVNSATAIPGTNQVRFILNDNITLMYDYYVSKWATHSNILAISGTLYQGVLTYLNSQGQIFQEVANTYIDGSEPVLMSFTTSWISLAGLQGYERFYEALLLGTYYTPFTLNVQFAYDYNPSSIHNVIVRPNNYVANWGGEAQWGSGGPWGGVGNVLQERVFPNQQKCETFQVTINEIYDSSYGVVPGQGLTLSGLALTVGIKRNRRTQSAGRSFG